MTWTSIPSGDLDPESPITTSLMNALYDNVAAALNRDAGAPAVGNDFITSAAQLAANVVGSSEIIANSVGSSELNTTIAASGGFSIPGTGDYLPAAGFYNFAFDSGSTSVPYWQIYASAAWRGNLGNSFDGNVQFCDGTNMRIHNTGGAVTVYYQKF